MTTKSQETRDLLLQAAMGLLMEGECVLTLDAVVKRAGISKGGLMHHFPSKDALIEGVVGEIINEYVGISKQASSGSGIGTVEETKAYVETSLDPSMRGATADLARGLIRLYGSDFRKDAPFLEPWRELFAKRLEQVRLNNDSKGFAKAAVITLAVECFTMIDVFNLVQFTAEELELIKQELLAESAK
jgi:AcrR family transcriptional regulator